MDELRVLDAKVSDILGHKVIGWETCVYLEGCWSIFFGASLEDWPNSGECGPIYQEFTHYTYDEAIEGVSEDAKGFYEKYGISISGCSVVPIYSKDANEALKAWELFMEKVPENGNYSLRMEFKQNWTCSVYCVGANFYHLVTSAEGETLPLALSKLIVKANDVILPQGLSHDTE